MYLNSLRTSYCVRNRYILKDIEQKCQRNLLSTKSPVLTFPLGNSHGACLQHRCASFFIKPSFNFNNLTFLSANIRYSSRFLLKNVYNCCYLTLENKRNIHSLTKFPKSRPRSDTGFFCGLNFKVINFNSETVSNKQVCSCYCTAAEKDKRPKLPDFEILAENVLEAATKVNIMAGSVKLENVVALLKELHDQKLPLQQLQTVLSQNLQLLQEQENVVQLTNLLLAHGIKPDNVVHILQNLPNNEQNNSIKSMQTLINNSLQHLRSMGFTEKYLHSFLEREPKILFVDSKVFDEKLAMLKELFTTVDALTVVKKSPNILSDPWSKTNKKFDYAYFTMGYKQQEIMRSHLFGHSLEDIQDRHIFLIRAGFFVPVKEKDDPRLNPNPPLRYVVDSSISFFVKQFGGMSKEEYETYRAMRMIERENEINESEFDDDDYETDSDEEEYLSKMSKKERKKK